MGLFSRKPVAAAAGGLGRGVVTLDDDGVVSTASSSTASVSPPRTPIAGEPVAGAPAGMDASDGPFPSTPAAALVDELSVKPKRSRFGFGRNKVESVTSADDVSSDEAEGPFPATPAAAVETTAGKPAKAAKADRKARRAAKAKDRDNSVDMRVSNRVLMEYYPGIGREDAVETARHWAMNHTENPSNCFFAVQKVLDGYMIEVQEGVGYSYIESVIDLAMAHPNRLVVVPMIRRKMTVYFQPRQGEFDVAVLGEGVDPPMVAGNEPLLAKRGSAMRPVMKQYQEWMRVGVLTFGLGALSLLSSLAFYAFDPKSKLPPEWTVTDAAALPVMQWGRLNVGATDSYVTRLEYNNRRWDVVRQAVTAEVDSVLVPEGQTAVTGGAVPPPTAPGTVPPPTGAAPSGAAPPAVQRAMGDSVPPPSGAVTPSGSPVAQ